MGGGGDSGALEKQETERQQKVQAAVDAINAQFGYGVAGGDQDQAASVEANRAARDAMYSDIQSATTETALRGLDRQYDTASKQNKFGLARSGLLGGSVDAESGADLSTRYGEGRMQAQAAGIGAASELRALDEKTRQNLISLAQSGIDTGTASNLALGQMQAAADSARSTSQSATVGDLFSNMGQAYLRQQQALGRASVPSAGYQTTNLYTSKPNTGRITN